MKFFASRHVGDDGIEVPGAVLNPALLTQEFVETLGAERHIGVEQRLKAVDDRDSGPQAGPGRITVFLDGAPWGLGVEIAVGVLRQGENP